MIDIGKIRERITCAEKSLFEGRTEEKGNEMVLYALTDDDVGCTLNALCEGTINIEKLQIVLSRHRLQVLMEKAEMWINVYSRGLEMMKVGSRSLSAKETKEIFLRYQILVDFLEQHGVVQITHYMEKGYDQCIIDIIGGKSVLSNKEIREFLQNRQVFGQVLQFREFGDDVIKTARLEHLEGDKVMLKDATDKLWLLPYQAILLDSM